MQGVRSPFLGTRAVAILEPHLREVDGGLDLVVGSCVLVIQMVFF